MRTKHQRRTVPNCKRHNEYFRTLESKCPLALQILDYKQAFRSVLSVSGLFVACERLIFNVTSFNTQFLSIRKKPKHVFSV